MITDLQAIHDSRASFYGKAKIETVGGIEKLISYNTVVATKKDNVITVKDYYSPTTARHINEYLRQSGAEGITKKEMETNPKITL